MTTFNQLPLNPADPIFYTVIDGILWFADEQNDEANRISVMRSGAILCMEIGENYLRVEFKDEGQEVDQVMTDFWELISSNV